MCISKIKCLESFRSIQIWEKLKKSVSNHHIWLWCNSTRSQVMGEVKPQLFWSKTIFISYIFFFFIHFQWKPQAIVFGIVTNKKFDMIIMAFIGVNMLTMTLDHYDQNRMWSFALDNLNMGFIVVFTTECILKIFSLRQYYFKEPWNVFDFIVVILSILGM